MKLVLTPFLTTEIIERIQKINLIAPMMLTRNLIKKKKMKNPSSIVFTASAGGVFRVSAGNGIYATTKCGIDAFMRTTALELGGKGIRCNSVNPGMVETNLIRSGQLSGEQLEKDLSSWTLWPTFGYCLCYRVPAFRCFILDDRNGTENRRGNDISLIDL